MLAFLPLIVILFLLIISSVKILNEFNWSDKEYERVLTIMREKIPNLGIGKTGFAPI